MRLFGSNHLLASAAAACWIFSMTTTTTHAFSPMVPQSQQQRSSLLTLSEKKGGFSLGNMFGGKGEAKDEGGATSTLRGSKLAPHPSVRKHISPLNRLGPDPQVQPQSDPLPIHPDVRSGTLKNGLPYVILPNKSPPGRFEAHLQVFSGSGTSQ